MRPLDNLGVRVRYASIPNGKAWLGGGKDEPGDQMVEIAHDFYLGTYLVTQNEWQKVMGRIL